MSIAIAVHGIEEANIVDDVSYVWEQVADHDAAFSIRLKRPVRADEEALELAGLVEPTRGGDAFSVVTKEGGFVIERVDVGGTACGKDEDDSIGFWEVVGWSGGERIKWTRCRCALGFLEQSGESEGAEASGCALKPFPS